MRVVVVLLLAALVVAEKVPHNPPVNVLIQQAGEVEESAQSLSNEAVVEQNLETVSMDSLKTFISERGVSDLGLIDDLITRAACIIRLEKDLGSLTIGDLQDYLTNRELSTVGSKDDLLDRSCDYLFNELRVRTLMGKVIGDVTQDDLKAQLTSIGFVSTSGTKPELIYRLGKAISDIDTIKNLLNDPAFEVSSVKSLLEGRGLSVDGTTNVLLTRLADYLVSQSGNTVLPGISSQCDIVSESSICVEGGVKVYSADATPRGLVGKWTFDDNHMVDHSGKAHHIKEVGSFGPGLNGMGSSAKFDGSSMLEIPHSDAMDSPNLCVTTWMYLLADSTGQWRTVLHKGSRDNERTPTLFLEPQTRGLELFVSTTDDSFPSGERVWSNSVIPLRKWTHVAACVAGQNLRLYINGILDAENTTIGTPVMNQGPLYVGNDPWRPAGGIASYIDELRVYDRVLTVDEIQAEAQFALSSVEPSFVELGCMGCSLDNCPKTCREGYRMCSQRDLYAGGYFVARGMGWATTETKIWSAEDGKSVPAGDSASGLCMCCKIGEQ